MAITTIPTISRGGGGTMAENRIHQRMPSTMARPPGVRNGQGQPNVMGTNSQKNFGNAFQRSIPSSHDGSMGRARAVKDAGGSIAANGNQMMLLRQTRTINAPEQNTQQAQRQKQQNQKQKPRHILEQESIGGISMLEVMQNLRMLEQQQTEARQKLSQVHQLKGQEVELQKQQHLLLEGKKFSNGQACGELDKHRDFLSFASRQMGERKSSSSVLDNDINNFHGFLDGGIKTAKRVKLTGCMVDLTLAAIEKKVHTLGLVKDKCSIVLKSEVDEYERAKEEEQRLRSSIHNSQAQAQKWAEQNEIMSAEVAKLEIDKSDVEVQEEDSKKELADVSDEINAEEDRFAKVKDIQTQESDETARQKENLLADLAALELSLQAEEATYENEKTQILNLVRWDGWEMDAGAVEDAESFKVALATALVDIETEVEGQQNDLFILEREIERIEEELKSFEEATIKKDEESNAILLQVDTIKEAEEERKVEAADVEKHLECARIELEAFEKSLRSVEEARQLEEEENALAECDMKDEQTKLNDYLEMLLEDVKANDQKLKAEAVHFEQIEMPSLHNRLHCASEEAQKAADSYHDLELGEFPEELDFMEDSDDHLSDLLQRHPELKNVDTDYDPFKHFRQQLTTVLRDWKTKYHRTGLTILKQQSEEKPSPIPHGKKSFSFYVPENSAIKAMNTDFSEQGFEPTILEFKDAHYMAPDAFSKQVRFKEDGIDAYDHQYSMTDFETEPNELVPSNKSKRLSASGIDNHEKRKKNESKKKSVLPSTKDRSKPSQTSTDDSMGTSVQPRRRSRKKAKAVLINDPKDTSNGRFSDKVGGGSVPEKIPQRDTSKEPSRKRKISDVIEKSSRDQKSRKNAKTFVDSKGDDHHTRRNGSKLESKKVKDTSKSKNHNPKTDRGVEKETVTKDKKSTKDRDVSYSEKPSKSNAVEIGIKKHQFSKSLDVDRRQEKSSTLNYIVEKGVRENKKGRPDIRHGDRFSKHVEGKPKISRSGQVEKQEKRKALGGILKMFELSRDNKSRKRDKNESSRQKKDEPRERTKTKSSSTLAKMDDVSKASKFRRSRKKAASTTGIQMSQKSGALDDDFGFKF